jgi:small-conductance mechanosensitive channel
MYYELLLVVTILLILTTGASILYFRRIREVHEEYEEAKGVVGDVVVSFKRQFQKQEDMIQALTNRTEVFSSESEKVVRKVEEQDRRLFNLADKIETSSKVEQGFSTQIDKLNKELGEVKESQKKALQRILEVEETRARTPASEAGIEAAIPIKKEKALAPLTETELSVLETIAKEGRKTAPEIRDKVKLTREHTARLMKKLYEDGYLERYTNKMPYTYRLKEEMQKILKKREAQT